MKKIIIKYGKSICSLAMSMALLASQSCRLRLYEPKEPEGLREFAKRK